MKVCLSLIYEIVFNFYLFQSLEIFLFEKNILGENIPLKLRENQGNVEVLFLTPPDPLHVIYLGLFNHLWTCLRKLTDLRPFEIEHHMKSSGQGPGGDFNS